MQAGTGASSTSLQQGGEYFAALEQAWALPNALANHPDWQGRQQGVKRAADGPACAHASPHAENGTCHVASGKKRHRDESISDGDGFDDIGDDDSEDQVQVQGPDTSGGADSMQGGMGVPDMDGRQPNQDVWQHMMMMAPQQMIPVMQVSAAAVQHGMVAQAGQLPLLPLVLPNNPNGNQSQQHVAVQGGQQGMADAGAGGVVMGPMMTPAAAAEAAVAEASEAATQAAVAASHESLALSMGVHWMAAQQAQQQQAAAAAAAAEMDRQGSAAGGGAGRGSPHRKSDGASGGMPVSAPTAPTAVATAAALTDPSISAAVDAATAAAMAGGADADTAAAMSASIAALMADPAAAAAAAAAMSDPNNPANMQALAHLAQLQSLGQLPPDMLNSGFSALVAAAVGMAALENGSAGGGAGLNPGMMGLPDPGVLNLMQTPQGGSMDMSGMAGGVMDMQGTPSMQQAAKQRARPRKLGSGEGSGGSTPQQGPTGNWMRRFHELAYLADKASIDNAKISNSTITVQVSWSDMPDDLQSKLSPAPAPIEVPSTATVSFLKRAIGRVLGGHLIPSVLRNHANRELLSDDPEDQQLAALGITHNSFILMEADYHPIANFGAVQNNSVQRLNNAVAAAGNQYQAQNAGSRVGSKERFTLNEMYSLVEGMEQHGLKWAKIHKEYKDLENKTQGDLKDKWRNWQRNVANGWSTARVYMPDELKQRIEKMVHEYNAQTASNEARILQLPLQLPHQQQQQQDPNHAALVMASHGLQYHAIDHSQLVGMDPATAAALAHQQAAAAHAMHHHHHYDTAAMAAALAGVGVDPTAAAAAAAAASQQHQQMVVGGGQGVGDSGAEHLMDPNAMQHRGQDPSAYQYDPSQSM